MARIGINARFLIHGKMEGFGWYSYEICRRLVKDHPEHEFILFFDRPYHESFVFGPNVTPVVVRPAARHPLLFILWFELLIPRMLKKYKIDLFFSPDGYVSLRSDICQVSTIHDINFEHYPQDIPSSARWYLRKYFPKFARKAQHIITVSESSRADIIQTYGVSENNISAVWNGASDIFRPLEADEKKAVRVKYSGSEHPYFVFVGSIHPRKNLNRLLEAYQLYSSSVKDPWHMVIVGENMWKNKGITFIPDERCSQLIHFTGRLDQQALAQTIGAAGALSFVPYFEGFGIPLVEAMKCGVPILSGDRSCLPEIAGDAASYCDPFDVLSIRDGLMNISSDENLRKQLAENALKRRALFSWDIAARETWNILESHLKK